MPMYVQSAIRDASAVNVTVGAVDGWATPTAGNYLLAICVCNQATGTDEWNTPAGWTSLFSSHHPSDANQVEVFGKVSDGTGSSLQFGGTNSKRRVVGLVELTGQQATNPVKSVTANNAVSQTSHTTPAYDNSAADTGIYIPVLAIGSGALVNPQTWGAWNNSAVTAEEDQSTVGTNDMGLSIGYLEVSSGASRSFAKSWTTSTAVQGVLIFVAAAGTGVTGTIAATAAAGVAAMVAQVDVHGTITAVAPAGVAAVTAELGEPPADAIPSLLNQVL